MESRADTALATVLALGLHVLLFLAVWFVRDFAPDRKLDTAGPVIAATLQFTSEDVSAAQAAIEQALAEQAEREAEPEPQPVPEPNPQTADDPLQELAQTPLDNPDTEDQQAVSAMGEQPSDETEVQDERQREEQVNLDERLAEQQEAENRQRLREQYEAIKREREQASQRTRMEEQRLAQLADRPKPVPVPDRTAEQGEGSRPAGSGGVDVGLLARYKAAMNTTARDNWNTGLAPPGMLCLVRFRQRPGGEVMGDHIEFIGCPYDAQARESVIRALLKTPMPYSGFETVFSPIVDLKFCHPEEACPQ